MGSVERNLLDDSLCWGTTERMAPKHAMLQCAANHPKLVVACDIFAATRCIKKIAQRIAAVSSAGAAL